ncbi:MAG: hypothetical protein ACYC4L_05375 [Chloroflexota bacterium]
MEYAASCLRGVLANALPDAVLRARIMHTINAEGIRLELGNRNPGVKVDAEVAP